MHMTNGWALTLTLLAFWGFTEVVTHLRVSRFGATPSPTLLARLIGGVKPQVKGGSRQDDPPTPEGDEDLDGSDDDEYDDLAGGADTGDDDIEDDDYDDGPEAPEQWVAPDPNHPHHYIRRDKHLPSWIEDSLAAGTPAKGIVREGMARFRVSESTMKRAYRVARDSATLESSTTTREQK